MDEIDAAFQQMLVDNTDELVLRLRFGAQRLEVRSWSESVEAERAPLHAAACGLWGLAEDVEVEAECVACSRPPRLH